MIYCLRTNGKTKLRGADYATIVSAMERSQWGGATDDLSYMRGVASRVEAMGGGKIATCCARHFLEDMEMDGLIERVE